MLRAGALFLTVFTGFTGLVYEVTWQRYLATLLGSHSEATAAVLGIFLAGLSLGYSLFGALTKVLVARAEVVGRRPRLLLSYGFVEAGIGAYALLFPFFFARVQELSWAIPHAAGGLGFAVDVVLAALLIGPPTVLMGGTIPILTQALARSLRDATRFHAFVYAFNTAGAFAGALLAGFVLVPWLGLAGVMAAMSVINLGAGAVFVLLGLPGRSVVSLVADFDGRPRLEGFRTYVAVALLSGFSMMVVQTVLIRLGGLSFGSSEFTFATVVAVFVLCIALGSFAVSALPRIGRSLLVINQWALVLLLLGLYGPLDEGPYWVHVLRTQFGDAEAEFYPYYLSGFAGILVVTGLPVMLSGATLPLLFHHMRRQASDLGSLAGKIYSWNTVGSLLGALLGGYALLFWLDLHAVYRVAIASLIVAAVLLTVRVYDFSRLAAVLLIPLLAGVSLLPSWDHELLHSGLFRTREVTPETSRGPEAMASAHSRGLKYLFHEDDPTMSVAVTEARAAQGQIYRSIKVNGKSDGNTIGDYTTMGLAALLPALMAEKVERAFVIGYGTGITVGELAELESTREVVVAEISPSVIRAVPWFDFANFGASRHPKVEIVRSDAYRALLRSAESYDVISSVPSNPWVAGVEMLYSREFLEAARERLTPGGVYVQWIHQYEMDEASLEMALRTYAAVFDRVAVWYGFQPDLLLLGLSAGASQINLERLQRRAERPDFAAGLRRCGIESFAELLAHELLPLGVVHAAGFRGPLHTLYHPLLSYWAGRAFFMGAEARLPFTGFGEAARVGAEHSLFRRYRRSRGGRLSEAERMAYFAELCTHRRPECVGALAGWLHEDPESPAVAWALEWLATPGRVVGGVSVENPDAMAATLAKVAGEVAWLLPGGEAVPSGSVPKAARRYRRYYTHAFPFEPAKLLAALRRCEASGRELAQCHEGLGGVERILESSTSLGLSAFAPRNLLKSGSS